MTRRAALLLPLALLLVGCTAAPAPAASTPAPRFTSEADAFAAAEETYRAYVDALNEVDLSDPATFEPVFAWTTGEANAASRKTFSQMHADGLTVSGMTVFRDFTPISYTAGGPAGVVAQLCLDVTTVDLTDGAGASVVPVERADVQPLTVTFMEDVGSTGLSISASAATDALICE